MSAERRPASTSAINRLKVGAICAWWSLISPYRATASVSPRRLVAIASISGLARR